MRQPISNTVFRSEPGFGAFSNILECQRWQLSLFWKAIKLYRRWSKQHCRVCVGEEPLGPWAGRGTGFLGECKLCSSTQNSSGGLWVWILYNWQCVYCTDFYFFTCIPKYFFNKSADPGSGDGNPFPAVYFSSWFCLLYTFKIVHVNQCKFSSSNFQI